MYVLVIVGVEDEEQDQLEICVSFIDKKSLHTHVASVLKLFNVLVHSSFLACAPQPTEDSSSPGDIGPSEINECQSNSILSDSDDRQNFQLTLKGRQTCLFGNFESDSLNENFSPTR